MQISITNTTLNEESARGNWRHSGRPTAIATQLKWGRGPRYHVETAVDWWDAFTEWASSAISGSLSFSPIPFFLSEASLLPLRVTLSHFTLSSYEQALGLQPPFPFQVWPGLEWNQDSSRSSWKAFGSTHPLMPSPTPREVFFACPLSPPWNPPFFSVESTLSSSCSRSDYPLSPRCGSGSRWLSPSSRCGDLDWLLCSFSFWLRRLWRTCQLLTLWHLGHPFVFRRPTLFKFFCCSL